MGAHRHDGRRDHAAAVSRRRDQPRRRLVARPGAALRRLPRPQVRSACRRATTTACRRSSPRCNSPSGRRRFLPSENITGFDAAKALVEQRLEQLQAAQAALRKKNQDAIAAFLAEKGVKSLDELPADQRPKQDYLGGTFGLTKTDLSLRKIHQKSQAYLERELKRFEPYALSVYSGPPNGYTSHQAAL